MVNTLIVSARYRQTADTVFAKALSFAELAQASRGIATYKAMPTENMQEGKTYTLNVTVWGIMQNPNYQVHIERLDRTSRVVQSREYGWMIRKWDHTLKIEPEGGGCRWTDRIEIDCSWATGYMTWVGKRIYCRRHYNRQGQDITAQITRGT